MKNPAGIECQYFFGDYFRGKNKEECRLLKSANPALDWEPKFCENCPVPAIRRANSCGDMQLKPSVKRLLPLMPKRVQVEAYCRKTLQDVAEPHIGCGQCHQLPDVFLAE
jgi:hypothetical protein